MPHPVLCAFGKAGCSPGDRERRQATAQPSQLSEQAAAASLWQHLCSIPLPSHCVIYPPLPGPIHPSANAEPGTERGAGGRSPPQPWKGQGAIQPPPLVRDAPKMAQPVVSVSRLDSAAGLSRMQDHGPPAFPFLQQAPPTSGLFQSSPCTRGQELAVCQA